MKRLYVLLIGVLVLALMAGSFSCAAPKEVEWRCYIDEAQGTPEWIYLEDVADLIYERTDGEVKITIYPEEALGYEGTQLIDVVGQGLLEVALLRCATGSGQVPLLNLGDLPFLEDNAEQARTTANAVRPFYAEALEPLGITVGSIWKSAPTGLTVNVKVDTLEAWKGLRIRSWSPTLVEVSTLLEASPLTVPFSEAFSALATGIIDGIYWTPSSALSQKTFDAGCKYYCQWNIFTMTNLVIISTDALEGLSSEAQQIVVDTFVELEDEIWQNEFWSFPQDYEGLEANGVEIVQADPAEIARVRAKTSPTWDTWLDKTGAKGLEALNALLAALGRPP